MEHAFHIRFATAADLPAIFDIYHEQVLHGIATFDTEPRTPAQQAAWFEKHPEAEHPVIVACDAGGAVVGWASLSPWSDRAAYRRTAEVSEYVHRDWRGRGVGSALLARLIDLARARGRETLIARMCEENTGSIRYHERAGFTTVGVMHRVGEKFGRVLDVRVMEMHLDRPPRPVTSAS